MYLKEYFLKEITPEKLYWKKSFQRYFVHEIMARDVITVADNLDYCMELMSTKESDTTGSWKQRGFGCDFDEM
jgi:hypothetical protein